VSGEPDLQQREGDKRRMLFFTSGGEAFALAIEAVEEIVVGGDCTPVPLAPPSVVGVINHRGRIFTVLDFARLAGFAAGEGAGPSVFLHHDEMAVGFTVESIEGIDGVPRSILERADQASGENAPTFLRGLLDFEGRMATIIDPARLTEIIGGLSGDGEGERAGIERSSSYGS